MKFKLNRIERDTHTHTIFSYFSFYNSSYMMRKACKSSHVHDLDLIRLGGDGRSLWYMGGF